MQTKSTTYYSETERHQHVMFSASHLLYFIVKQMKSELQIYLDKPYLDDVRIYRGNDVMMEDIHLVKIHCAKSALHVREDLRPILVSQSAEILTNNKRSYTWQLGCGVHTLR